LIMMTSMGEKGDTKHFADIGFSAYFPKPTSTSDLLSALSIVVDRGEALDNAEPLITHDYLMSMQQDYSAPVKSKLVWQKNTRILLVEDNRINQLVALGVLNDLGLNADVAGNGIEAIESLKAALNSCPYSVVIMDCQMPEMDGYDATRAIRQGKAGEENKNIPIVAMTANAMQGDKEKCLQAGMSEYLAKPIASDTLRAILVKWLKPEECSHTPKEVKEPTSEVASVELEKNEPVIWQQEVLLKRVNGNLERMVMLVDCYLEEDSSRAEELSEAIFEKDQSKLKFYAHKVKGASANLGGEIVYQLSSELELLTKEESFDFDSDVISTLVEANNDLIRQLKEWREQVNSS